MALHSAYNSDFKGRVACGFPIMPFNTKIQGPGQLQFQNKNHMDVIDEAFAFFRINVLFKNYEIKGPGDKVLIYLLVFLSHLFKIAENIKDEPTARKRLSDALSMNVPLPKDKTNFMAMMLEDGPGNERDYYIQYIKHLKAETVQRFLQRFYGNGLVIDDFKFWAGPAKKKFMGLNYTSMF